jgi:tetratricopeptide (TPR) repeat protein
MAAAAAVVLAIVSSFVTYRGAIGPQELVRLAILPFETDSATKALSEGVLLDAGDQLRRVKGGRTQLTLVPLTDALQNRVDQPAKARTMLGATHSLSGAIEQKNGRIVVRAYLSDTRSLVHVAEWRAEYSPGELRETPVALAGMVTGALRLPPIAQGREVNAAAYRDYATGASIARRETDVEVALPFLERAVAADPNSPLTWATLADAQFVMYRKKNDPRWKDLAYASVKKAEQRNPDVALVRFVSGTVNDDAGQYEQALADFQRAVELEPTNADYWRRLAKTYEHDNQPNKALAAYRKAIEIQPDYFKNYQDLGQFHFARSEYDQAEVQYKKMVELAPDLAVAHAQLSTPYLDTGRFEEAERELKIAISLTETATEWEGLGLSKMYQDRDRDAIPYLLKALEVGPKRTLLYLNLGTAYRRGGFPRESREAYTNALDLAEARLATNPRDAYEKACLAYVCARLGERRRAEAEVEQALQLSGGATNVRQMAALTYEALGLHDQTIMVIEDAPDALLRRLYRHRDLAELRKFPRFKELIALRHIQ